MSTIPGAVQTPEAREVELCPGGLHHLGTVSLLYPAADVSGAAYGGLFWSTIGSRTGMWLFQPVSYMGCAPFQGVGILTVALNYN